MSVIYSIGESHCDMFSLVSTQACPNKVVLCTSNLLCLIQICLIYVDSSGRGGGGGGDYTIFSENLIFFSPCHNFFPLSSVQIIIIPACCLLCVL